MTRFIPDLGDFSNFSYLGLEMIDIQTAAFNAVWPDLFPILAIFSYIDDFLIWDIFFGSGNYGNLTWENISNLQIFVVFKDIGVPVC